eukprot:scpid38380/ scgid11696/ 
MDVAQLAFARQEQLRGVRCDGHLSVAGTRTDLAQHLSRLLAHRVDVVFEDVAEYDAEAEDCGDPTPSGDAVLGSVRGRTGPTPPISASRSRIPRRSLSESAALSSPPVLDAYTDSQMQPSHTPKAMWQGLFTVPWPCNLDSVHYEFDLGPRRDFAPFT